MAFRRFCGAREGTSAVEFAILSPFYLLLLFGLIAYGVYISASHSVQQIAADAARIAIAGLTDAEREALAASYVQDFAGRYAFVDADRLSVAYRQTGGPQNFFIVTVTLDGSSLPIWALMRDLPLPPRIIEKQAVMRTGTP